jgi:phage repressor protein C with HTH and peptisase S24 domain
MLLLGKFKIVGHSMEPQIKNGESVLVSCISYLFKTPRVNDIVAFARGNQVLIKRVVSIQNGKYFVEGYNKKDSLDSRKFGAIVKNKIIGKMIIKL